MHRLNLLPPAARSKAHWCPGGRKIAKKNNKFEWLFVACRVEKNPIFN
jgi:hypothetical protein